MMLRLFTIAFLLSIAASKLSCLDRSGKDVPWFALIKYPNDMTKSNPRYAYLDSNGGDSYQVIKGKLMDSDGEAVSNTFGAINGLKGSGKSLMVYNDEPPGKPASSDDGHAKGILAFDTSSKTGVYIIHSLPNYPTVSSSGILDVSVPETAEYGQNMYCISLNQDTYNSIIQNIPVLYPNTYYSSGCFGSVPTKASDDSKITQFKLLNEEEQWFLTKNPKYDDFLYEDIIEPYFDIALSVESWGRPYQPSTCPPHSKYDSYNIEKIAFNSEDTWENTSDHSKWAVTTGSGTKVACMCDMNRMTSQLNRGGSCLCTKNSNIFKALNNLITSVDKCGSSS